MVVEVEYHLVHAQFVCLGFGYTPRLPCLNWNTDEKAYKLSTIKYHTSMLTKEKRLPINTQSLKACACLDVVCYTEENKLKFCAGK
jgi:hypothetical protein